MKKRLVSVHEIKKQADALVSVFKPVNSTIALALIFKLKPY